MSSPHHVRLKKGGAAYRNWALVRAGVLLRSGATITQSKATIDEILQGGIESSRHRDRVWGKITWLAKRSDEARSLLHFSLPESWFDPVAVFRHEDGLDGLILNYLTTDGAFSDLDVNIIKAAGQENVAELEKLSSASPMSSVTEEDGVWGGVMSEGSGEVGDDCGAGGGGCASGGGSADVGGTDIEGEVPNRCNVIYTLRVISEAGFLAMTKDGDTIRVCKIILSLLKTCGSELDAKRLLGVLENVFRVGHVRDLADDVDLALRQADTLLRGSLRRKALASTLFTILKAGRLAKQRKLLPLVQEWKKTIPDPDAQRFIDGCIALIPTWWPFG